MKAMKAMRSPAMVATVCALMGVAAWAQQQNQQQQRGRQGASERRGRGGWGDMNQEEMQKRIGEMRERMVERVRESLGFSEEEWVAVKPLYVKVAELDRRIDRGGRGMRLGRRGGANWSQPDTSALGQARTKLSETVQKEDASSDEIKAALAGYRAARLETMKELEEARKALREVLTLRQEAMLVNQGVLD